MYLFQIKVTKLDSLEDREVACSSMIGDITDLKDQRSVMEIMEKLGKFVMEFNSDKKGQVE